MPLTKKLGPKCSSKFALNTPVTDIINDVYGFPYADTVPAGKYASKIVDILDSTTSGTKKPSVDVLYDLEDNEGNVFNVRLRYPLKSAHITILAKKLLAEGYVKRHLAEAIGATEDIIIEYKDDDSMGEIAKRSRRDASAPLQKSGLGSKDTKATAKPSSKDLIDDEEEDLTDEDLADEDEGEDEEDFNDFAEEDED